MACYYPRPAWREKHPNKNGRHEMTFSHRGSQLTEDAMIPCGKCEGCRATHRLEWAIRMHHESLTHEQNSFLTLTYEDAPEKLDVNHLQTFIKRLRRRVSTPLRYFACGEYGEETHRAHYHAIIFGHDFRGGSFPIDDRMYGNTLIDRIWSHGTCSIDDVNMAGCCYVAGYVTKKIKDTDTFNIMSRKPPIGYKYAVQMQDQLARLEHVVIEGSKLPIPKVYLEWAETTKSRPQAVELDTVRGNRRKHLVHRTPQQLRNREINQKARAAQREHKI